MNSARRLSGPGCVRGLLLAGLLLAGFTAEPRRSEASPELRDQLSKMAGVVADWLKEQGQDAIVIGPMVSPPSVYPSPGLKKMLADALVQHKVRPALKANLQLVGKYHALNREQARPLGLRFSLEVVDGNNKTLKTWDFEHGGATELAFLLGLTTATPPNADPALINQQLNLDRQKSPARIAQEKLLVDRYGLEILVDSKPRPIRLDAGQPFAPIAKGEVYAIRLTNDADHDAAVWVAIDGLSVFEFNEDPEPNGRRRDYQVVVPKGGTTLVQGWYRRAGTSDAFLVTDYAKSAAALKNSTAKLGMITAQFRACWEKGTRPPLDEILERGAATGFGPTITERWTTRERNYGAHRATLTVRYSKE